MTGPVEMAGNLSVTGAVRLTGRRPSRYSLLPSSGSSGNCPRWAVSGGLEHCVAAAEPTVKPPEGMSPGELYLYSSGGASIYLKGNGSVAVTGPVETVPGGR